MTRLLIVDDDVNFSHSLARELEKNRFEPTVLPNGKGVIELLKKEEIPIVILDVMLPKISGFELCREIRVDREIYDRGIIIISVMGDKEEIEHGYAQGCDDYIPKPLHFGSFLTRLKSVLDMVENNKLVDTVTTLGSARFIKLEILRGILLKESFDLAYIELLGVLSLMKEIGNEGVIKLLRMFSHHLKSFSATYLEKDYYLAHIGGGHFIAKFRNGVLQDFILELKNSWENLISKTENLNLPIGGRTGANSQNHLGVMACGFTHFSNSTENINRVLERLRILYSRCKSVSTNGVLIDRRSKWF